MAAPGTPATARDEPQGLGGWLIAWAAWAGLVSAVLLLSGVGMMLHALSLGAGPARVGDVHIQPIATAEIVALKVEALVLIVVALLGGVVLWLHLARSRRARPAYCAWLLAAAAFPVYAILRHGFTGMALPLVVIFVGSIAGVAYFLRSRRVRNTFVR